MSIGIRKRKNKDKISEAEKKNKTQKIDSAVKSMAVFMMLCIAVPKVQKKLADKIYKIK